MLIEEIAEKIVKLDRTNDFGKLPTCQELAKHYKVSRLTVLKAVKILKDKGVLLSRGRGGIYLKGQIQEKTLNFCCASSESLFNELSESIYNGTYATGHPLPKFAFFTYGRNITGRTVCKAYQMLVEKKLAHQKGKQWIVGPAKTDSLYVKSLPVIVILMPQETTWRDLCRTFILSDFAIQFNRECENYNVQTFPVLMNKTAPEHLVDILPAGKSAVKKYIESLGSRYLGSIVVLSPESPVEPKSWIRMVGEFGKPIIGIDSTHSSTYETLKDFHCANFYYASVNVHKSVRIAVELLNTVQSRLTGIVQTLNSSEHSLFSTKKFCSHWNQYGDPKKLITQKEKHLFWERRPDGIVPADTIKRLQKRGIPAVRKILNAATTSNPKFWENQELYKRNPDLYTKPIMSGFDMSIIWTTNLLVPLLKNNKITSLIASDDFTAVTYYYWLNAVGITVPDQISLLSFGNDETIHPLPISCIDFGFDKLGYAAFHLILGDIPVRVTNDNLIMSTPSFVDRGSVGYSKGISSFAKLEGETV